MFLICPKCLYASQHVRREHGLQCASCRYKWDSIIPCIEDACFVNASDLEFILISGEEFFIIHSFPFVIGRDSEIRSFQNNLAMSRRHCEVDFDYKVNMLKVTDLGSQAGTLVNNNRVAQDTSTSLALGVDFFVASIPIKIIAKFRTDVKAKTIKSPPVSISLLDKISYVYINDSGIPYVTKSRSASKPYGIIAQDHNGRTAYAINHDEFLINNERFTERKLQAADLLNIAGYQYCFDIAKMSLEPESPIVGSDIILDHIRVLYGKRCVLSDISGHIPSGRLTVILGQSGTGKTTLMKVLSGALTRYEGRITVLGGENYGAWAREKLAVVPQHDVVHDELTVRQCLEYASDIRLGPLISHEMKTSRVTRAIDNVALSGFAHQSIDSLSGGQRKRVNVAVELIRAPEVILLDEPTTGLDYVTEKDVILCLKQLSRVGHTVVFVTHSLMAIDYADHVIVIAPKINSGATVLAEGSPSEVKSMLGSEDWTQVIEQASSQTFKTDYTEKYEPHYIRRMTARFPRLVTLIGRYIQIWFNNPFTSLALFFGMPLFLGFLVRLAVSSDGRLGNDRLLFGAIAIFWLGMNQSVREIVREKMIFIQDQANHVGCGSFLLSKFIFFSIISMPQAVLLSFSSKWFDISEKGLRFSYNELDINWSFIVLFFWVGCTLGSTIGLMVSSACLFLRNKGEAMAVLLTVLFTLPQILFSAKVLPQGLSRDPIHYYTFTSWHSDALVPEFLSYFSVSRYLFNPLDAASRHFDNLTITKSFIFNGVVLSVMIILSLVISWMILEVFCWWNRKRS